MKAENSLQPEKKTGKKSIRQAAGAACSAVGLIMLLAVVIGCLPFTLPKAFGYEIYTIVSGSMEPEIPVGSIVYAKAAEAETLEPGEIAVFYGGQDRDTVVTHRVVENHREDRELITRGDANAGNDVLPVPYGSLIGRVERTAPVLGKVLPVFTTTGGKLSVVMFLIAAILLRLAGERFRKDAEE